MLCTDFQREAASHLQPLMQLGNSMAARVAQHQKNKKKKHSQHTMMKGTDEQARDTSAVLSLPPCLRKRSGFNRSDCARYLQNSRR